MIFAQTPLVWPEILNHSVAIGVALFCGYGLIWITKRLFGTEGIITKGSERNAETMEKFSETLIELTNLNRSQQDLCSAHAGSMKVMERFSEKMIELHTDPESTFSTVGLREKLDSMGIAVDTASDDRKKIIEQVDEHTGYHEHMHETWGKVNPAEFRVPPMLDALMHTVDMLEKMEARHGHADECREDFVLLRSQIQEIKREMTREA